MAILVYGVAILGGIVTNCVIKACDPTCERREGYRFLASVLAAVLFYMLGLLALA